MWTSHRLRCFASSARAHQSHQLTWPHETADRLEELFFLPPVLDKVADVLESEGRLFRDGFLFLSRAQRLCGVNGPAARLSLLEIALRSGYALRSTLEDQSRSRVSTPNELEANRSNENVEDPVRACNAVSERSTKEWMRQELADEPKVPPDMCA